MYRQILVPTEKAHSIELPKEYYGVKVEVIAFPYEEENLPVTKQEVNIDAFYDAIKLNFSGYTFNRDEANER